MFRRTDEGIYYLHTYYPKRYEEHRGTSERIIDFKDGNSEAIQMFTNELEVAIVNEIKVRQSRFTEKYVVIVPSHTKNQWSDSLLTVAHNLCERLQMNDYSEALVRFENHPKLAWGGNRSIQSHLDTIKISPEYDVEGKEFIILDDVTTSGGSIQACREILKEAGAIKYASAVIGKTY